LGGAGADQAVERRAGGRVGGGGAGQDGPRLVGLGGGCGRCCRDQPVRAGRGEGGGGPGRGGAVRVGGCPVPVRGGAEGGGRARAGGAAVSRRGGWCARAGRLSSTARASSGSAADQMAVAATAVVRTWPVQAMPWAVAALLQ